MSRSRAVFGFISVGGLLVFLSPYLIHEAIVKHFPWSVAIIVIPAYAVLSYGALKLFWPRIIGKSQTGSGQDPQK
jgi:hypothetical protein